MQTRTHSSRATHHLRSRRLPLLGALAPLALLAVALLAAPAVALAAAPAPANLIGADPATNAVLSSASKITSVTLTFSETLARTGDSIVVYDARGRVVSTGALTVKGDTLTIRIRPDGDGSYLVLWHATGATGGKPTIGAYTFAIGAASDPTGEVGSTSAAVISPSGGISPWWALLTAIIGLGAGVLGASRIRDAGSQLARRAQALRNRQPSKTPGQSHMPWER